MTQRIAGTRRGTAPTPISILLGGTTGTGQSARESFAAAIRLAELADRRGFERLWVNEHHAMPAVSASSPAVLLARLTAHTTRLRLGSGGVMLPNHAPLVIAEQFGMLNALAEGRIDLGLGRAPGTDLATARALRRDLEGDGKFAQQVAELMAFLDDDFPESHPYAAAHAVPGPWQDKQNGIARPAGGPSVWLLGSSMYSARLAGILGRPYAYAYHLTQDTGAAAIAAYRDAFRPSVDLEEPYAAVSAAVTVGTDARAARDEAATFGYSMLEMFRGRPYVIPDPETVKHAPLHRTEREVMQAWTDRVLSGTADAVTSALRDLHRQTTADELIVAPTAHSAAVNHHTVELIADAFELPVHLAEPLGAA